MFNDYVIEERFSAWQKKRVRTIVVNSRSRTSTQRSIQGALACAKAYDRIELVGGEYFETLSISIPLEIVAAEGEDPRIVSRGLCLTVTQGVEAYFEHVEFISKGKNKLEAAVALMHGSSVFFRCKMSSIIIGGFATPHIERCTISESYNGIGIQISDNAGAVLQNCIVHTHHLACVVIDTRGVVKFTDSSIYQPANSGHVLMIRAVQSFAKSYENVPDENLSCRQVTVDRCNIYMTSSASKLKDRDKFGETFPGTPSCVVISHGAAPVFTNNDLLEGVVGFTLEFAGPAVLRGNKIRNQRECGVLAIVEEVNQNDGTQPGLKITGGNIIDHCFIGIDVHCKGRSSSKLVDPLMLSNTLPSGRSSFNWLKEIQKVCGEKSFVTSSNGMEKINLPFRLDGERVLIGDVIEYLRAIAKLLFAGHPKHFYAESADTRAGGMSMSTFGRLLSDSLGVQTPPFNQASAVEKMLRLRGNCGVDIFETRFSSCDFCAIRFGCNGYGLVESCDFMNCGATAIVVHSGAHPVIIGCKLEYSKRAGILLENFANPLITANEIHHGAEHGIEINNMSRGIVMGNAITSNNSSGVCVCGGSSTIIAANLIQYTRMAGVAVGEGSKSPILMNKFMANEACHLLVAEFSTPFIAGNEFTSGLNAAIRFESCGGGTVINNNMHSNGEGIVVELDADPYVLSNTIINNFRYGILVRNNGLGTFVDNEVRQNAVCNVYIKEGGSPVLRNNQIHEGGGGGVVFVLEGRGYLEHNTITKNAVGNVVVMDRFSEPILTSNSISSSATGCGIICARDGGGTFSHNTIFQNCLCGVYVIGKANPKFLENTISREIVGVIVSSGGQGTFDGNEILMSYGGGITIQLDGDPIMQHNRVSKCAHSGLLIAAGGRGKISENEFFENDVGIQLGSSFNTAELDVDVSFLTPSAASEGGAGNKNSVTIGEKRSSFKSLYRVSMAVKPHERRNGLQVPAEIRRNKISHNNMCGVLLESAATGLLEDNVIEANDLYGVMADVRYSTRRAYENLKDRNGLAVTELKNLSTGGGTAVIRKNRIFGHKSSNVCVLDHPENDITISENDVYDAPTGFYMANCATIHSINKNTIRNCRDGVVVDSGGRGCFEANNIRDCHGVGVYVSFLGNPEFKKDNTIEKCRAAGVFVDAGGKGLFTHTTVRQCLVGVVVYTCPPVSALVLPEEFHRSISTTSAPTFEHCTIERNEQHGVLVLTVATGFLLRHSDDGSRTRYEKSEGFTNAPGATKFPIFRKNTICRNRLFGVCHEIYEKGEPQHHSQSDVVEMAANAETPRSRVQQRRKSRTLESVTPRDSSEAYKEPSQQQQTSKMSQLKQSQQQQRMRHQEALGTSTILDTKEHFDERMRRQVSFIENTITDCSIGVVVGGNCHPFLLRNQIHKNTFFGLMLRCDAKAMCYGCEVSENGIAGLYAAPGSLGSFKGGSLMRNNVFTRFFECPTEPRRFSDSLPLLQPRVPRVGIPSKHGITYDVYEVVLKMMDKYLDLAVDGLRMLFELVASSSAGLSIATTMIPNAPVHKTSLIRTSHTDFYSHAWAADGGIGAWIAQGSMTEVIGSVIENNRNAGIFFSRGAPQHHKIAVRFHVEPVQGFPLIPVDSGIGGDWGDASPRYFFTSAVVRRGVGEIEERMSLPSDARREHVGSSNLSLEQEDKPFVFVRPAKITGNRISGNGCGIFVHLFHVMQVNELSVGFENARDAQETNALTVDAAKRNIPTKRRQTTRAKKIQSANKPTRPSSAPEKAIDQNGAQPGGVNGGTSTPSGGVLGKKDAVLHCFLESDSRSRAIATVEAVTADDPDKGGIDISITFDENHIFTNTHKGIACQHVVEIYCGNSVASRLALDAAVKECEDICAQFVLQKEVPEPKLPFTLTPLVGMVRHARFSGNDVYKNPHEQMELTSRYVAVIKDGTRTLLNIDTLTAVKTSTCSSQVLLKVPLFAALLQQGPPGLFLIDNNRFHEGSTGVRVIGLSRCESSRLRRNKFVNIAGDGVVVDGHLAAATIGNGNIFEGNNVGVRVVLPPCIITEAAMLRQQAAGILTCVYANRFIASKKTSVLVEGSGGVSPLFYSNEFTDHQRGTAAVFIEGSKTKTHIMRNFFYDNYVPFIVANQAGAGEGGSVLIEENRFFRNYIGMFICSGAAPTLIRNTFEENYRSGLEITGIKTSPILRNCVFMKNKRPMKASVIELHADSKLDLIGVSTFSAVMVEASPCISTDDTFPPAAGITLGEKGGGRVIECLFSGNDLGVDVARMWIDTEMDEEDEIGEEYTREGQTMRNMCFTSCLFTDNLFAGVLVRGRSEAMAALKTASSRYVMSSPPKMSPSAREATVFDGCFFLGNTCDTNSCGDVLSVDGGYSLFRKNLFAGCVHGGKEGAALFVSNTFLSYTLDVAVYMHKGTRVQLERNTIRGHKTGVVADPAAWGRLEKNWVIDVTHGVLAAPYAHTLFVGNRIMLAKECGVLAYGGVFSENEICRCPMGVIIENPSNFKTHHLIPAVEKTSYGVVLSGNRVHTCDADGILVAGGGRIEQNRVSNCKQNIHITCPRITSSDSTAAVLSNNDVYDGEIGVLLAKGSAAELRENDIFDNSLLGVWCKPGSSGLLQGNNISIARNEGALQDVQCSDVKVIQNTIRNQFSPAYHKALQGQRVKERLEAGERLATELRQLDALIDELQFNRENVEKDMRTFLEGMVSTEASAASINGATLADSVSKLLLRTTTDTENTLVDLLNVSIRTGRFSLDLHESRVKGFSTSKTRENRTADRRMSGRLLSTSRNSLVHVLIHVSDEGRNTANAARIGKEVETVFSSTQLTSRALFKSVITTSSSALEEFLTAQTPHVFLLVIGTGKHVLNDDEKRSLHRIERTQQMGLKGSGENVRVSHIFILLPHEWKGKVERCGHDSSPTKESELTLENFAARHVPIFFDFTPSDAVGALSGRLLGAFTESSAPPRASEASLSHSMRSPEDNATPLPRKTTNIAAALRPAPLPSASPEYEKRQGYSLPLTHETLKGHSQLQSNSNSIISKYPDSGALNDSLPLVKGTK